MVEITRDNAFGRGIRCIFWRKIKRRGTEDNALFERFEPPMCPDRPLSRSQSSCSAFAPLHSRFSLSGGLGKDSPVLRHRQFQKPAHQSEQVDEYACEN